MNTQHIPQNPDQGIEGQGGSPDLVPFDSSRANARNLLERGGYGPANNRVQHPVDRRPHGNRSSRPTRKIYSGHQGPRGRN